MRKLPARGKQLLQTRPSLIELIRACGLTNGLLFCLDAGDINSYTGGSLRWLDTSGNNNHFILGGAEGTFDDRPFFQGTPGRRSESEYFAGDSAEEAKFVPLNAVTYDDSWHKNNGLFSFIAVAQVGLGNNPTVFCNNSDSTGTGLDDGVSLHTSAAGNVDLTFRYDTSDVANSGTIATNLNDSIVAGRINFAGVSFLESGPTLILQGNNLSSTTTVTASGNTQNPPGALALGCISTVATNGLKISSKYFMAAAWSVALTATDLRALYDIIKLQRYPTVVTL